MLEQMDNPYAAHAIGTDPEDARLAVLRLLAHQPGMSQRDLAQALGVSLGKTHYVLHALLDKGLLKAQNFRRSDNKVAYAYVLTPRGIREKLRMTRSFLSRKEAEFDVLCRTIVGLRSEVGAESSKR
jgi:EPS-associated MarR family transcriptional regulator